MDFKSSRIISNNVLVIFYSRFSVIQAEDCFQPEFTPILLVYAMILFARFIIISFSEASSSWAMVIKEEAPFTDNFVLVSDFVPPAFKRQL